MARLIVAKDGYNITSDRRYLLIDSDLTNLMIIEEKDISGGTASYSHNLGYLPTTFEFFKYGTQWFPVGSPIYDTSDSWVAGGVNIEYDTNTIYFTYEWINSDVKLFITGNSADNQTGSGKNTAIGKLKIAKDGFSIDEITDVRQFSFCSGLDTLKKDIGLSGITTIEGDGTFTKKEITHNLGYVPVVIARLSSNTYNSGLDNTMLPINLTAFDLTPVSFYITSTKIVFFTENVVGNFTIKYNLYRNKIA